MKYAALILFFSFAMSGLFLFETSVHAEPGKKKRVAKSKASSAPKIQGIKGGFVDVAGANGKNPKAEGTTGDATASGSASTAASDVKASRSPSSVPANTLLGSLGKSGGTKGGAGQSVGFAKGGGTAGSGGAGGPRASIEFDDDQAKRKPEGKDYGRGDTGGGSDNNAPPGGGGPPRQAKPLPRWWPMCIFMDPAVPGGNAIVKQMVDEAADCGVNLVVFPFYMKDNYPRDAAAMVATSKAKCNAVDGLGKMGANRASVVSLVNDSKMVQDMCGGARDVTGCAELGFDPGDGIRKRMASTGSYGGLSSKGKMAAAIIGPGGFSAKTVAGKALGQAMMALPPGWNGGNEVGDENEGYAAAGIGVTQKGWSKFGCQKMREAAFPNTDQRWKWNPDQKDYLVKTKDESRMLDITDNKSIWKNPNQPPQGGDVAKNEAGGNGGGSSVGGSAGDSSGASSPPSGGSAPPATGGNGGHKFAKGGAGGGAGGALGMKSLRAGSGSSLRGGGSGPAIYGPTENEGATEGGDGSSSVAAGASSGPAGSGPGGASVGFDDKVQKGGIGSVTANAGGAAGAKGAADAAGNALLGGGGAGGPGGAFGGAAGAALTAASSSLKAIKSLQDDFFGLIDKRLKDEDDERNRKRNPGESLRKGGSGAERLGDTKSKKIYQGIGGDGAVGTGIDTAEGRSSTSVTSSIEAAASTTTSRSPASDRAEPSTRKASSAPAQHPAVGEATPERSSR